MDALILKAETTYDTDERWRVQGELAEFIFEQVLSMPLYAENAVWPLSGEGGLLAGCTRRVGLAQLLGDATA